VRGDPAGKAGQGVPERRAAGPERDVASREQELVPAVRLADQRTGRLGRRSRHDGVLVGHRVEHRRPRRREVDRAPPTGSDPSISALRRTNSSTTSRKTAPGNGTWSRVHCAIAWKPRTNSSFQRFSSSVARWATIVVGASMKNPL
jgi:hypothetical protein